MATPTGGSLRGGSSFHPDSADHHRPQELAYARQHFFLPHRYRDPFHTNAISTESFVTYDAYDLLLETRDALGNRSRSVNATRPATDRVGTTIACSSPG